MEADKEKLNFFEKLITSLPVLLAWLDSNNVYQGCNDAYAKIVGLSTRFDIDRKRNQDLPCYKNNLVQAVLQDKSNAEVLTQGKLKLFEESVISIEGDQLVFLSYKIPLCEGGKIIGLINLSLDITERKKTEVALLAQKEQAEVTLDHIIAHMPGHVYWKDRQGAYLGCNDRQARSLGLNYGDEVVGKTDFELPWSHKSAQIFRENDQQVMDTGSASTVEEKAEINGKEAIMLSQKVPLRDKHRAIIGVLGISVDITHLKQVEMDLRKVTKEKAEIANQLKTDFIRNMQHDIRTPFVGVWTMIEHLHRQETDAEKKALLGNIAHSAKALFDYCNDIADFSKIESGALPSMEKKFEPRKLIDTLMNIELPAAKMKQLELTLDYPDDIPPILIGDDYRLQRILLNLLSNAIKFTQQGHVTLRALVAKQPSEREVILRFFIQDTGMGIASDKQDIIYEKFVRTEPSNKGTFKGMGLGLRIVKQFVDEMSGELELKSALGVGTTFICTLPFKLPLISDIL